LHDALPISNPRGALAGDKTPPERMDDGAHRAGIAFSGSRWTGRLGISGARGRGSYSPPDDGGKAAETPFWRCKTMVSPIITPWKCKEDGKVVSTWEQLSLIWADVYRLLGRQRSEEHTSELQSRENLVCRLLLE